MAHGGRHRPAPGGRGAPPRAASAAQTAGAFTAAETLRRPGEMLVGIFASRKLANDAIRKIPSPFRATARVDVVQVTSAGAMTGRGATNAVPVFAVFRQTSVIGGAPAAAIEREITGGGAGITRGAVQLGAVRVAAPGDFQGLNLRIPDSKLPPEFAADAQNVDSIRNQGALAVRRGMAKLKAADGSFLQNAIGPGGVINGLSINALSDIFTQSNLTAVVIQHALSGTDIGSTSTSITTSQIRTVQSAFHTQPPFLPHPTFTIQANGGGTVTVRAVMPSGFTGIAMNGVIVRVSTVNFPRDPDGRDATESAALRDREAWDGLQLDTTETGQTAAQVRYYSIWAFNRLVISERVSLKVTVAA